MLFTAKVYAASLDHPTLVVSCDEYNLDTLLNAIAREYNWVFDKRWRREHNFECRVGTLEQFANDFVGRLVIEPTEHL